MRMLSAKLVAALAVGLPGLAAAQTARVGAHYGVNLTEGHWQQERLGMQAELRAVGPLVVSGAVSRFVDYPGVSGWTGSAMQLHANVRLRSLGKWSFLSVGYGFVVLRQSLHTTLQSGSVVNVSDSEFTDTAVLGLEIPTPYVRPFGDLYLISLLDHQGQVGVNLLMGVQVPMPMP